MEFVPKLWNFNFDAATITASITKHNSQHLLVLNEPNLLDQANINPTAAADLYSEIYLMTSMNHPNVLPAIAMGVEEGLPFLVLEKLASVLAAELPKPSESVPFWTYRAQKKKWCVRSKDMHRPTRPALAKN